MDGMIGGASLFVSLTALMVLPTAGSLVEVAALIAISLVALAVFDRLNAQ